jgi:LacI family transcriptional regulator
VKLTIKEIAREIGMSPSSVSRALNDYVHTSKETKEKVAEAAFRLGYRHNALASGLRNNKSNIIGLIVPRISMPFQATIITAIQNKLHEFGYNVIVCQSNESPEIEKNLVEILYGFRVEGIIVSSTIFTEDFTHFKDSLRGEIPLVFYDRIPVNFQAHKIRSDDYKGAFDATNHLIEQGCKRIVHIGGVQTCSIYKDRFNGYRDALKKSDIEYDSKMVFFQELTWGGAIELCKSIFHKKNSLKPDGMFLSNDTTALAIISYAKANNIAISKDLKIVGYSNDERVNVSQPSLSSVEQYPQEMGEAAAKLIMDIILKKLEPGKTFISITTPIELKIRKSSTF